MRNHINFAIAIAALVPLAGLGLVLSALERAKLAIFGADVYWSERHDSPVR